MKLSRDATLRKFMLLALVGVLGVGGGLAAVEYGAPVLALGPARQAATAAAALSTVPGFVLLDRPRPLPPIHFVDGGGRSLKLADFRGRTVLVNIWATWCGPCQREMLTLERLQRKLGGTAFLVLPLSIDRQGLPAVERFYRGLGLKALGIYVDRSGEASSALGLVGLPTTLLVDPEGHELARKSGVAEWDSATMIAFLRQHIRSPE